MHKLCIDILVYNLALCLITGLIMVFKPRLFLGVYPNEIQKMIIPKTTEESKLSMVIGLVFLSKAGVIDQGIIENPEENEIIVQAEVYFEGGLMAKSTYQRYRD